jgi:hypothetical protein
MAKLVERVKASFRTDRIRGQASLRQGIHGFQERLLPGQEHDTFDEALE